MRVDPALKARALRAARADRRPLSHWIEGLIVDALKRGEVMSAALDLVQRVEDADPVLTALTEVVLECD